MANFKGWEIIIVLALLLLLFGAKRLPDAARGLGRSLRIFKAETKGLRDDDDDTPSRPGRPRELPSGAPTGARPARARAAEHGTGGEPGDRRARPSAGRAGRRDQLWPCVRGARGGGTATPRAGCP